MQQYTMQQYTMHWAHIHKYTIRGPVQQAFGRMVIPQMLTSSSTVLSRGVVNVTTSGVAITSSDDWAFTPLSVTGSSTWSLLRSAQLHVLQPRCLQLLQHLIQICRCSSSISPVIKTSSRYTTTLGMPCSTFCMKHWKIPGADETIV